MTHCTRRAALKRLGWLGAWIIATPHRALGTPHSPDPAISLAAHLRMLFTHTASAAAIGNRYLAATPSEADPHTLAMLIARTPQATARLLHADPSALRRLLAVQQRSDFRAGNTVTIDGWVLSQTEARLCALVALTPPP